MKDLSGLVYVTMKEGSEACLMKRSWPPLLALKTGKGAKECSSF
jgi:hypothetical protein